MIDWRHRQGAKMTEWRSYVLWVQYLQTTDPATWTEAVKRDYGSCIGHDAAKWASANRARLWNGKKGARLPHLYRQQELLPTQLAVVVDVAASDGPIFNRLASLIAAHRDDCGITVKSGRTSWTPRRGKWQLSKAVEDSALIALDAWQERNKGKKLADVGLAIAKQHGVAKTAARDGDTKELSTVASKYLRIAQAIRAAVVEGRFPT
jgi:hypothetical protein